MNTKAGNAKNFFGHIHSGSKTTHGYGICDVCGNSENSDGYAKKCTKSSALKLIDYICVNYDGSQRAFAAAQGVQPPQVTQWIQKDFIVVDGQLYSPRRELKT